MLKIKGGKSNLLRRKAYHKSRLLSPRKKPKPSAAGKKKGGKNSGSACEKEKRGRRRDARTLKKEELRVVEKRCARTRSLAIKEPLLTG